MADRQPSTSRSSEDVRRSHKRTRHLALGESSVPSHKYLKVCNGMLTACFRLGSIYTERGGFITAQDVQDLVDNLLPTQLPAAAVLHLLRHMHESWWQQQFVLTFLQLALMRHEHELRTLPFLTLNSVDMRPDYLQPTLIRMWWCLPVEVFLREIVPLMIELTGDCCLSGHSPSKGVFGLRVECRHGYFPMFVTLLLDRLSALHSLTGEACQLIAELFREAIRRDAAPLAVPLGFFVPRTCIIEEIERLRDWHCRHFFNDTAFLFMTPFCCCPIVQDAIEFLCALRRITPSNDYLRDRIRHILMSVTENNLLFASLREYFYTNGILLRHSLYMPHVDEACRDILLAIGDFYIERLKYSTVIPF